MDCAWSVDDSFCQFPGLYRSNMVYFERLGSKSSNSRREFHGPFWYVQSPNWPNTAHFDRFSLNRSGLNWPRSFDTDRLWSICTSTHRSASLVGISSCFHSVKLSKVATQEKCKNFCSYLEQFWAFQNAENFFCQFCINILYQRIWNSTPGVLSVHNTLYCII